MAGATIPVTDPELRDQHYAYVCDIAERLGLSPTEVAPVFYETLQTLAAGATVEIYVVLLAAKKTMAKLRSPVGTNGPFHGDY
ncbi:hypothetical protein RSP822_17090 [Ralstonia solanacearum]|uniref:DUF3562 domain-containing protein n=1 Tax=Ralstonia solanacearum TaxID=305 RepID=UPI000E663DFA|nr:DUF3562 domain-containing protein [Ralstonia solanacearum]RIJ85293.1 hypothetical protein RSP822_17090 [Ralstonia solanacearum]